MDEHTEHQVLMKIGKLDGKLESMQAKQNEMCRQISALRKDITGVKIKVLGFGTILGGVAGFITKYIP